MHLGVPSPQHTMHLDADDHSEHMHRIVSVLSPCHIRSGFTYRPMQCIASERFRTDVAVCFTRRVWIPVFSQQRYYLPYRGITGMRSTINRNVLDTIPERYEGFAIHLDRSGTHSIVGMWFALATGRVTTSPRGGAFAHAARQQRTRHQYRDAIA